MSGEVRPEAQEQARLEMFNDNIRALRVIIEKLQFEEAEPHLACLARQRVNRGLTFSQAVELRSVLELLVGEELVS